MAGDPLGQLSGLLDFLRPTAAKKIINKSKHVKGFSAPRVSNVFGSPYSRESQYFLFSSSWPHKEELLLVVGITQLLSHVV